MSLCVKLRKWLKCCKHYKVNPKKPHKCYHETCRHCKDFVNIYNHKCYIQPVVDEMPEDTRSEDVIGDHDDDDEKKLPPLLVFGDIECLIEQDDDEGRKFLIADLIRYATEEDPQNVSHVFSGDRCIEQFIHAMNNLTEVEEEEKQRDLIMIFHNLKGFDRNFMIEELYRQGIKVENQLTTGTKTLKFNYRYMKATITFKDSLYFLPVPLADLPDI